MKQLSSRELLFNLLYYSIDKRIEGNSPIKVVDESNLYTYLNYSPSALIDIYFPKIKDQNKLRIIANIVSNVLFDRDSNIRIVRAWKNYSDKESIDIIKQSCNNLKRVLNGDENVDVKINNNLLNYFKPNINKDFVNVTLDLSENKIKDIECVIKNLDEEGYYPVKYISKGVYGKVYRVCNKLNCNFIVKTSYASIENDVRFGTIAGEIGVGPNVYLHGKCKNTLGKNINYIVMEYIEGVTINNYDIGKWSPSLFIELGNLLYKLYEVDICHKDLHLGNVIIKNDGTPVIIDYGKSIKCTILRESLYDIGSFFAKLLNLVYKTDVQNIQDKFEPVSILIYSIFKTLVKYPLTYNMLSKYIYDFGSRIERVCKTDILKQYKYNKYSNYILEYDSEYIDDGSIWEILENEGVDMDSLVPADFKIKNLYRLNIFNDPSYNIL